MSNNLFMLSMNSLLSLVLVCVVWHSAALDKVQNTSDFLRHSNNGDPRPPVVLIPGMIASRLVSWKQKKCVASTIEIQDVVWLNLQKMVETMTYDKKCWLDCMKLGTNGTDPKDCKLRPDEGLSAIGELSPGNVFTPPGTSVFTNLIRTMSKELGYDSNNIIGAPYDWRLAPSQMEKRDSYFSTLKFKIESSVERHGRPAIVIGYSMGNNLFQYFMEWLRVVNQPSIGYHAWMRRYIWSYVGISAPLLGASPPVKSVLSGHTFGLSVSEAQARDLLLTCPSTHNLNPRSATPLNTTNCDTTSGTCSTEPELEYIKPIVTIKGVKSENNPNVTYSKSFDISDVESGELYRWIGEHYKDSHLTSKFKDLIELYDNDPVQPLKLTYRRPPVKHVLMLYGVDLPTEVAYSYQVQNTTSTNGNGYNGNSAPSAIPSSVVAGVSDWLNRLAEITGHTKLNASSTTPPLTAATVTGTTSSSVYSDYLSNPLVLDETFFEDSNCHILNHKKQAAASVDPLSLLLPVLAEGKKLPMLSSTAQSLDAAKDPSSATSVMTANTSPQAVNPPALCRSEVYAVKTVGNPIEFITNGGPVVKRYVISNGDAVKSSMEGTNGDYLNVAHQMHSGDTTVPYVSLSHAKTWLNEDSEGCEFNWSPPVTSTDGGSELKSDGSGDDDLVANVLSMQDRVIELNKRLKIVDEEERSSGSSTDDEAGEIEETSSTLAGLTSGTRKLFKKFTNVITTPSSSVTIQDDNVDGTNVPETMPREDARLKNPQCKGQGKQWQEKVPSRVHKHFLDDWGAPMTMTAAISNADPATESFFTQHANGDSTAVIEVSGLDHLEIVKHAYVHELMFRHLLSKMSEDLHLV